MRDAFRLANRKHDVVAIQVADPGENQIPDIGLVQLSDPETGKTRWIDTRRHAVREGLTQWWLQRQTQLKELFSKSGVDFITLTTDSDYVVPLVKLFKSRGGK